MKKNLGLIAVQLVERYSFLGGFGGVCILPCTLFRLVTNKCITEHHMIRHRVRLQTLHRLDSGCLSITFYISCLPLYHHPQSPVASPLEHGNRRQNGRTEETR